MSSPVVATVAWLALAAAVVLGVVTAVLARRVDVLARSLSDRKWEIATLRSELSSLRPDPASGGPVEARSAREVDEVDEVPAGRSRPSSPTAWRRGRSRAPVRPARRRRPG